MLANHSAPYLHMREFAHSRGAYAGWNERQRRALLAGALDAIDGLGIVMIGAVMRVADYRKLDPQSQVELVDPTFCCFQECLHGIALNAYLDFPTCKTDVVYSRQDEFAGRLRKLYEYSTEHVPDGSQLGVLSFQDMRVVPGLQLVDMVAYELRHFYHLRATAPERGLRYPFRRIVEHQRAQGAALFKYIPGWELEFQAKGVWPAAQNVIWNDPDRWRHLIAQMVPEPLDFAARFARLKRGRDAGIVHALRQRRLR